jgi:hypothetical protein
VSRGLGDVYKRQAVWTRSMPERGMTIRWW